MRTLSARCVGRRLGNIVITVVRSALHAEHSLGGRVIHSYILAEEHYLGGRVIHSYILAEKHYLGGRVIHSYILAEEHSLGGRVINSYIHPCTHPFTLEEHSMR